jgi:hypothetical protein
VSGAAATRAVLRPRREFLLDLVPLALVLVAEGAWVAVVGWLVQEYALRPTVLGIPDMVAFVGAGIVAERVIGRRSGAAWPPIAVLVVALAGTVGVLLSAEARAAIGDGPIAVITTHPGGLLAAAAVLRGFAHATLPPSDASVARLVAFGVPGLAIAGLLGGLIRDPFRADFLGQALLASIVFVATATPALALSRLSAIGQTAGFDWRRNPVWAATVVLLVAATLAAAMPLAGVAGTVLEVIFAVTLLPMLILGLTMGFDRTGKRVLAFTAAAVLITLVLSRVLPMGVPTSQPPDAVEGVPNPASGDEYQILTIGLAGVFLVVAMAMIVILAAAWMRRQVEDEDDDVFETRTIDRDIGPLPGRRARGRRWRRRSSPTDAAAAYEALLHDLERHPGLRRRPTETPAEHARRLRVAAGEAPPADRLALDLLAADYALDRFAAVELAAGEHRRAIRRWRVLRHSLPKATN